MPFRSNGGANSRYKSAKEAARRIVARRIEQIEAIEISLARTGRNTAYWPAKFTFRIHENAILERASRSSARVSLKRANTRARARRKRRVETRARPWITMIIERSYVGGLFYYLDTHSPTDSQGRGRLRRTPIPVLSRCIDWPTTRTRARAFTDYFGLDFPRSSIAQFYDYVISGYHLRKIRYNNDVIRILEPSKAIVYVYSYILILSRLPSWMLKSLKKRNTD